ncbi:MAG: FKBP-type peptidyl-prolyl cis-trans isomerase [Desulfopila sp.]|jgi:peptidylprolyl isomerase/FKBP-type peptidyl-prolyl cis-trans isomerase FklB|nr:FKBP-type peptidyl-prolyl cis-trans isomerase [Desulfopila sp.]
MKNLARVILVCIFMFPATLWAEDKGKETVAFESFEEKLGYSMGLDVGNYFKGIGEEINFAALLQGLEDAFEGNESRLSAEEIAAVQKQFGEKMQAKQQQQLDQMKEDNLKLGAEFLEENKKKEGVVTTESGLQYKLLEKGDGPKPKATDKVKVDYVGTLVDGTEFDSSIKRGEPAIFGVDQVIPGWSEALQLMEVGSKYQLVIPSELAYGEKGAPPVIEPNAVLVFEVDLLGIEE